MLDRDLDEPQSSDIVSTVLAAHAARRCPPLPQRQICRARTGTQALCSPANDNGDGLPRPALEDIVTRALADGADAHRKHDVSVERHTEIRR